ncbi:hypothetical protein ACTA71_008154 [Dictyostelium dimigraforme]
MLRKVKKAPSDHKQLTTEQYNFLVDLINQSVTTESNGGPKTPQADIINKFMGNFPNTIPKSSIPAKINGIKRRRKNIYGLFDKIEENNTQPQLPGEPPVNLIFERNQVSGNGGNQVGAGGNQVSGNGGKYYKK